VTVIKKVSSIAVAALAFAALCHGAAFAQWRLVFFDLIPYDPDGITFFVFLSLSLVASGFMFAVAERRLFRALLALKAGLILVAAHPFGARLVVSQLLLYGTIAEICAYETYPANLSFSVSAILASLLSLLGPLWKGMSARVAVDLMVYVLSAAGLASGASLLTRYRQEMISSRREAAKLDRAVANLASANKSFLTIARAAQERSTRDERNRITRELHDSIGYALTNLIMTVRAAKALAGVDGERLQATLDSACEQAQRGLAETRRCLHQLREQEVLEPHGLSVVHRLVTTYEKATGVHVDVQYTNVPMSLGEEVDSFIYQFVQEGLTNSFRHGKATCVRLHLWKDTDVVRMNLWDNGVGAVKIAEGIGLLGMREQLGQLGGTLEARNVADGFTLSVEIPLRD
jgi:signal transduction histidine kinase